MPEASERTVTLPLDEGSVEVTLPADATPDEAAALVACLGAHLHDWQRAAGMADDDDDTQLNGWTLAGRYGSRLRSDLPRQVERGQEWKMASRARRLW